MPEGSTGRYLDDGSDPGPEWTLPGGAVEPDTLASESVTGKAYAQRTDAEHTAGLFAPFARILRNSPLWCATASGS